MRKSDTQAFVNHLIVYTLALICFGGTVGMGTVWLRHQIATSADTVRDLESRIRTADRRIAEQHAAIESASNPAMLEYLNKKWNLGLQQATPAQVWHINADPVFTLAAKRNRELFNDGTEAVSFNVALRN